MCEIEVARAKEELALFQKNKSFQKFEITDEKTGAAKFVSLKDVELNSRGSILDQTLEYFMESRDRRRTRHQLEKIVKEKELELKENLKSAQRLLKVVGEETRDYKTKSFFGAVNYLHAPVFTPKELIAIELRIQRTGEKSEAAKLQKLLVSFDHSKAKNLPAILASFAEQKEFSKTTEQQPIKDQPAAQSVAKNEAKAETNLIGFRENKIENHNLERER